MARELKLTIKSADMEDEMQEAVVKCAKNAMTKYTIEREIASHIKKEFDQKDGPTWHCIVGKHFGSYVTHDAKHFIYFYLGQTAVLLFKST